MRLRSRLAPPSRDLLAGLARPPARACITATPAPVPGQLRHALPAALAPGPPPHPPGRLAGSPSCHLPLAQAGSCLLAASAVYPATVLRRPPPAAPPHRSCAVHSCPSSSPSPRPRVPLHRAPPGRACAAALSSSTSTAASDSPTTPRTCPSTRLLHPCAVWSHESRSASRAPAFGLAGLACVHAPGRPAASLHWPRAASSGLSRRLRLLA
nr:vegetative cell wall protein gp1-like [Aegilops tauschii subsp. strangulata]